MHGAHEFRRLSPEREGKIEAMDSPIDEPYTILEQKLQAYDAFHAATGLLKQALESDDMTAVCRFIKSREALIAHIDGLDRRFNHQQQSVLSRHDPAIMRRRAKISADLGERLKEILSANQACDAIAAGRCEVLKRDLATIRKNEDGLHVYAGKAQGTPKFLSIRT
jgi:hypothetical protein